MAFFILEYYNIWLFNLILLLLYGILTIKYCTIIYIF